jgi:membrane protein DedA with SNARE-associated domain
MARKAACGAESDYMIIGILLALLILVGAIIGYVWWKRRKDE